MFPGDRKDFDLVFLSDGPAGEKLDVLLWVFNRQHIDSRLARPVWIACNHIAVGFVFDAVWQECFRKRTTKVNYLAGVANHGLERLYRL